MKMENLLKCEQVLINLYAKVEQRDTLSNVKKSKDSGFCIDSPTPKEKSDLEAVRNKLKTVAKRQENVQDTLPEILPLSEMNDVQTSGTKEPALFQRRPNLPSNKTTNIDESTSPPGSATKRSYTRVLVSPESSSRRWSTTQTTAEKPLFSRRSPRKSPRRYSPSYHKKERKKSKESTSEKRKDLNITLNVPEESLQSLNTKDILSRIINCSDGDVDIDTLRELRKQILSELQKTGAKDDISDLILKSYNKNINKIDKPIKDEIEEGELSDSESEAIESIYGSLVVEPNQSKVSSDNETQPRKIQICLVINSDDKPETTVNEQLKQDVTTDFAELVMYEKDNKKESKPGADKNNTNVEKNITIDEKLPVKDGVKIDTSKIENQLGDVVTNPEDNATNAPKENDLASSAEINLVTENKDHISSKESIQFKANFYKPLTEQNNLETTEVSNNEQNIANQSNDTQAKTSTSLCDIENTLEQMEKSPEIPLLHDRTIEQKPPESALSEIDILQALKNEILSDIPVPGTEIATPLLHQPKVMKVASAKEILPKKRISIEKYKQKSATPSKLNCDQMSPKDDPLKKPSLKLTDKECERFNIPNISFDDEESADDDDGDVLPTDLYSDLAPKSPEQDDYTRSESAQPVVPPVEPTKPIPVINKKSDVDMRTFTRLSPKKPNVSSAYNNIVITPNSDLCADKKKSDKTDQMPIRPTLIDPRVRRDLNISNQSHNLFSVGSMPNSMMTPNARAYDMTPTHQPFEIDQSNQNLKHVYFPSLPTGFDFREKEMSVTRETGAGERRLRTDDVREYSWNSSRDNNHSQHSRFNDSSNTGPKNDRFHHDKRDDIYHRPDGPTPPVTSTQAFSRSEVPMPSISSYVRPECPTTLSHPLGRLECPPALNQPYGRLECPPTSSHHFGRFECPSTPSHPFGRSDCPATPNHPFGRSDCPPTPIHPFGRTECPSTPSHPFGRSDCPSTPNHPFGRGEGPAPLIPNLMDCNMFSGGDCPSTPTPLFGRNECPPNINHTFIQSDSATHGAYANLESPQTPSHPFGRSEPTKVPYGRSDFNSQKYTKDPRLYRKPESESKSQYEERGRGYYNDRDRYHSSYSQKHYSSSDTYRNYDRDSNSGKKSKYKYYAPDSLKDRDKRERSLSRSMSKDYESDGVYNREHRYYSEDVGSRRVRPDDTRSSSRTPSVNRKFEKESEHNSLQVKSNVGRSFTIDTSINATFQKHIDRAKDILGLKDTFDSRRERAASVGRSLVRESSVGRTLSKNTKPDDDPIEKKRKAFRRACSVGRELIDVDKRSFQEIKADFKSCKFPEKHFYNKNDEQNIERNNYKFKDTVESSGRSRKDIYDKHKTEKRGRESTKSSYSPRKNYRDPRMRRQLDNRNDRRSYDAYGRKSGIVYSNDNIVTGSIMASGYGVKNYKIPKIKRVVEEKVAVDNISESDKKSEKDTDNKKITEDIRENKIEKEKVYKDHPKVKDKNKVTLKEKSVELNIASEEKNIHEISKSDDNIDRRLTRSSRKNIVDSKADTDVLTKPRRIKKLVYTSDSGSESDTKDKNLNKKDKDTKGKQVLGDESKSTKSSTHVSPIKDKKTIKKLDSADLDANFGIDELEMFPDNIVSDPVIDNINALIADLDNDLSTGKNDISHNFTNEITLENMLENISSPEKDNSTEADDESCKILRATGNIENDKSEIPIMNKIKYDHDVQEQVVENELSDIRGEEPKCAELKTMDKDAPNLTDSVRSTPTQSDAVHNKKDESNSPISTAKSNIEHIDSTTEMEVEKDIKLVDDKQSVDELIPDACSTPDSTINTDEALLKSNNEESMPGCTNEVTSTESIDSKSSSAVKEPVPGLDSFGSLLSILQDKSKIKELLNMLSDTSNENEKIKKKLEKLSEIVSDDEETIEVPTNKLSENKVETSDIVDNVDIDSKRTNDEKEVMILEDDRVSKNCIVLNENDSKLEDDQLSRDSSKLENDDTKGSDNDAEQQETDTEVQTDDSKPKKKPVKKSKGIKRSKLKLKKPANPAKRITRATTATKPKVKKPPRELMQLQEDIREMFMRDDVLSATGIRMCRLAKLVDEKVPTSPPKEDSILPEAGPVVVLQKFKDTIEKLPGSEKVKNKKIGPKSKAKTLNVSVPEAAARVKTPTFLKNKPGPKSKTKSKDSDPYDFELDSIGDTTVDKASDDESSVGTESESDSLASTKSFGSSELLSDIKKKTKRKRRGWQAGVIKTKAKKKKIETKQEHIPANYEDIISEKTAIPALNCFTDQNYCFRKNQFIYACRLCSFCGPDIVLHYRNQHPHVEIPLSRMAPEVAKEAIEQCEEINFKAISKIASDKYVCTFCYKEFGNSKSVLETFFWHIVSMHTGEYKQNCFSCVNVNDCPFNLDIPPPPKDVKGQLIGYICKKCNFTQISLENLKTHVIVRHNDEETAVYTINLSVMTKKSLNSLLRRSEAQLTALPAKAGPSSLVDEHKLRDSIEKYDNDRIKTRTSTRRVNRSVTPIQAKITFEGDDNISELSDLMSETGEATVKIEKMDSDIADSISNNEVCPVFDNSENDRSLDDIEDQLSKQQVECPESQVSNDILDCPHFKINHTATGAKEYFCCINGNYHFKTTLLISMKKHVQFKHSENWDGYCYMCKVIVTPQGVHRFRDCLQHYLDKHIDNFPIFDKGDESTPQMSDISKLAATDPSVYKNYINVRPLSDLITKCDDPEPEASGSFPIIHSVVSLGAPSAKSLGPSVTQPEVEQEQVVEKIYKYEEHQAEIMSKKYYLVLQTMIIPENLVRIFKCSGRYCLYATDSTEEALAHATTHQRIGGTDALNCCYCNFDSAGNAVDLVMHVFKDHGSCQYCCQQCFYRAASSQAVGAHMTKVHKIQAAPGSVLRTSANVSLPRVDKSLSREEAVSFYTCGHNDADGPCKFRTYTPDKFCEHLEQRHSNAATHPCNLCSVKVSDVAELVKHMKTHGLKLYQCKWCVHGADNEGEMLSHVSCVHPDKQPQAYIRIITNKDGTSEKRVLPLAFLNKHKVPSKEVVTTATKEHPVREAERSIEMEALIGPFMTEPTQPKNETPEQAAEIPAETETLQEIKPPKDLQISEPTVDSVQVVQPSTTPAIAVVPVVNLEEPQASAVKTELVEQDKSAVPDVVVLDSDDEDTKTTTKATVSQPIIDLSEEEVAPSLNSQKTCKISSATIYMCPNCKQVYKSVAGLKIHIYRCHVESGPVLDCPHCGHSADTLDNLMSHYMLDHSSKPAFECGVCGNLLATENYAKKHLRNVHKEKNNIVIASVEKDGITRSVIGPVKKSMVEPPKQKVVPKNANKIRFEPQEIDQLPINPILNHQVYCSRCEFSTKVRLNMVRHLQQHAEQQPVAQTAPVNPVPHLESNEKHFDKMVNLASSSIVNRLLDKQRSDNAPAVTLLIPPEAASRYPKYVSERQRHTCGAKGCSYISVDEAMLRCHWETLHSGTSDFHCVHCPPHQHLDTSKPLTANRILSHLKMHDATLYACSSCSYYHFKREALEKHLSEVHKGGKLMVVREEYTAPVVSPSISMQNAAPTMDLKPWQCGLCKFKSMLRPEVVDHCFKSHQSKMQYKCAYCPFRTSAVENISKHQTNSHAGKPEEVFYYYYREGSIPDEVDGTPKWIKQCNKMNSVETQVKVELEASEETQPSAPAPEAPICVDLNLVKKELEDVPSAPIIANTIEDLCKLFGNFCDPNGINFKCPLCSVIMEDTKENMQSHLYEELNYRKWSCGLCSYKAFHKAGLTDHMTSEHRRQYDHVELPTDLNIERWVSAVLAHQASIIDKHKDNLVKQKIVIDNTKAGPSAEVVVTKEPIGKYSDKDLEIAFGVPGSPNNTMFCCPKCGFISKEEAVMRDHLESELNKIRWCCSICPGNFQTYHEAQFHCKCHDISSRPVEAIRDPAMRAAWVSTALEKQKKLIQGIPTASISEVPTVDKTFSDSENSLLVVRYEEQVATPDQVKQKRKRPAPDSDDERLVIDEPAVKKKIEKKCPYCEYKSTTNVKLHMFTHFNLKPYTCGYCTFSNVTKKTITKHIVEKHVNKPLKIVVTELPPPPLKPIDPNAPKVTCLVCEKSIPETEIKIHFHKNIIPEFTKNDIVVKCCLCLVLCADTNSLQKHHNNMHPNETVNYALYKLGYDSRETYKCGHCNSRFRYVKDCRTHHTAVHKSLLFSVSPFSYAPPDLKEGVKQEIGTAARRCARKSTTKLPNSFARKSTTKLPYTVPRSSLEEGYSYYGTKPIPLEEYKNVTTLMSFCNMMMPFSMKQLSEHLNIEPKVLVTDVKNSSF